MNESQVSSKEAMAALATEQSKTKDLSSEIAKMMHEILGKDRDIDRMIRETERKDREIERKDCEVLRLLAILEELREQNNELKIKLQDGK